MDAYAIMFATAEHNIGVATTPDGQNLLVYDNLDTAYDTIQRAMQREDHPLMMWVRKLIKIEEIENGHH